MLLLSAHAAWGDSDKKFFNGTGHICQRFDQSLSWNDAKLACESQKAHLATVNSFQENDFIKTNILFQSPLQYYQVGGTDQTVEGSWRWVTGEPFDYARWRAEYPDSGDYMLIWGSGNSSCYGQWDASDGDARSYISFLCEWETNQYVATAAVADLNGNGKSEIGVLYINTTTRQPAVWLRDAATQASVKSIGFLTINDEPKGVGVVGDLNGSDEIVVQGVNRATGAATVEIRDSKTGAKIGGAGF